MTDKPPDSDKLLRQKLMDLNLKLLERVDALYSTQDDMERDKLIENLKPVLEVFTASTKWYGVATKGHGPEDEGEAFHGFRQRSESRVGEGSNPGGNGGATDHSELGRARPSAKAHRRRTRAFNGRDGIVKPQ